MDSPGDLAYSADMENSLTLDDPLSLHPVDTRIEDDTTFPAPPLEPDHIVVIFGGGPVAQEVAAQAARMGFSVDVLGSDEDMAPPDRFPTARQIIHSRVYTVNTVDSLYPVDSRYYIVILTHSFAADQELLTAMLRTEARYIGISADPATKERLFDEMRRRGFPKAELACVRCPIGLAIGAKSTEEMGIAIVAELIAARAGCLPRK